MVYEIGHYINIHELYDMLCITYILCIIDLFYIVLIYYILYIYYIMYVWEFLFCFDEGRLTCLDSVCQPQIGLC